MVVNTARGPVVDEEALAEALHVGTIFAAGPRRLRATSPRSTPACSSAPRTVLLPHIGSASRATRTQMAQVACQGVCDVLAGAHDPTNLVTGLNGHAPSTGDGSRPRSSSVVLPRRECLEHRLFLVGARPAGRAAPRRCSRRAPPPRRRRRRRASPRPPPTRRRRRPLTPTVPGTVLRGAPQGHGGGEHREAVRLEGALTSRTPPSMTRPATPRVSAPVVSTSPQYPNSSSSPTSTASTLPRGALATATWMARLSPGLHRTGKAGAASRAPGQAA